MKQLNWISKQTMLSELAKSWQWANDPCSKTARESNEGHQEDFSQG